MELLDPHCVKWEPVTPEFEKSPPNCCQEMKCLQNSTCQYEGFTFTNFQEIPQKLTGCEKRCYCEYGNVTCQNACPPMSDKPPTNLPCPPEMAMPVTLPHDECCLTWVCRADPQHNLTTSKSFFLFLQSISFLLYDAGTYCFVSFTIYVFCVNPIVVSHISLFKAHQNPMPAFSQCVFTLDGSDPMLISIPSHATNMTLVPHNFTDTPPAPQLIHHGIIDEEEDQFVPPSTGNQPSVVPLNNLHPHQLQELLHQLSTHGESSGTSPGHPFGQGVYLSVKNPEEIRDLERIGAKVVVQGTDGSFVLVLPPSSDDPRPRPRPHPHPQQRPPTFPHFPPRPLPPHLVHPGTGLFCFARCMFPY